MEVTAQEFQKHIFQNAYNKGFHTKPSCDSVHFGAERLMTRLMLITTEVAEAAECVRDGDLALRYDSAKNYKPEGLPAELADIGIRLMDLCESIGVDLWEVMKIKHSHNLTRVHLHGKNL